MKTKQRIDNLSIRVKIIIVTTFMAIIVALVVYSVLQRRYQEHQDNIIQQSQIMLAIKDGKINALITTVANRDSSTQVLIDENKKKDELLKRSEANKKIIADKYRNELARQQKLSDSAAYILFLSNMGCSDFKGGRYDSSYLVPIESLWAANGVVAENNMLTSLNKVLAYDATVYKMKIKTLDNIVSERHKDIVDLQSALKISDSKSADYGQQIDALNKKIKSNKRKTTITYIVGSLALIGALIL